jgi:hypothetical protein
MTVSASESEKKQAITRTTKTGKWLSESSWQRRKEITNERELCLALASKELPIK